MSAMEQMREWETGESDVGGTGVTAGQVGVVESKMTRQ